MTERSLEDTVYMLEREIIAKMKRRGASATTVVSRPFRGGLSAMYLRADEIWYVDDENGGYRVHNPLIGKLIEKFALITDRGIQEQVGDINQNDYDCERQRLRDLERLLRENRNRLLEEFVSALRATSEKLGK